MINMLKVQVRVIDLRNGLTIIDDDLSYLVTDIKSGVGSLELYLKSYDDAREWTVWLKPTDLVYVLRPMVSLKNEKGK